MKKMLFLACMALTLAACEKDPDMNQLDADLVVYTDHDNNAAFDGYKTYFLPDSILEAGGYKASYWKDENAKALVDAVAQQMDSRGYTRLTDPEKKDQADVGVQLSYVAQTNHVVPYPSYGGWWDYGFWGPWWGGWYYPYPVSYSYDTQTMLIEMVDLTKKDTSEVKKQDIPVVWYVSMSGFMYGNGRVNQQLLLDGVNQAFEQSPYIQSNK